LGDLQREAETAQNSYFALRVATVLSIVRFKANKHAAAFDSFDHVLSTAAIAGVYSTILDEGRDAGPLLVAFHERARRTDGSPWLVPHVDKLMAGWQSRYGSQTPQMARSASAALLSDREGEILKLITGGRSNKEIARTLAITPETVKSHMKRIFAKLEVKTRAQAVSRAQSLGFAFLIDD
jgi:LuxR family maltose regulon positive regulatory protein